MAQDIKVGTIFPLSGGAGPDGQSVTNAVKLAIEQINEKGGLLGRKITLISKDDESTPAVGVSRANEMIAEKVDLVIEGWNSPVTLAMQPILARAGILDITAVSKSDLILSGETNPLRDPHQQLERLRCRRDRQICRRNAEGKEGRVPDPERRLWQRLPDRGRGRVQEAEFLRRSHR